MAARIQLRRDTSSNWSTTNPTLNSGELGVETNTSKIKLGDGSTAWNSLDYVVYPLAFSDLLSKPTTIAGYGITDASSGVRSRPACLPRHPTCPDRGTDSAGTPVPALSRGRLCRAERRDRPWKADRPARPAPPSAAAQACLSSRRRA